MFDVGFWEMSIIALIALVVLGPERLPGVARTAGLWIGRAKRMVSDVKADIDREIRNSEIKEMGQLKESLAETGKDFKSAVSGISDEVTKTKDEFDLTEAIQDSAKDMNSSEAIAEKKNGDQ